MSNNFLDILDKAFRRARLSSKNIRNKREKYINKVSTVYNILNDYFDKLLNEIPDLDSLTKLEIELYEYYFGINKIRKLRRKIIFMKRILRKLFDEYKHKENIREYYGRIVSIFKRNKDFFNEYKEFIRVKRKIPNIKKLPTVVIAGLPNVGKSTLLKNLTGSEPEIKPFPFTTKDLMLGYIKTPYFDIQVIDTPGILDRPFDSLNFIERKAYFAIKELSNILIYVFDCTETSGFSIDEQINLYKRIKENFNKDILIYFSKKDIFDEKSYEKMKKILKIINEKYFSDYNELSKYIVEYFKQHREIFL